MLEHGTLFRFLRPLMLLAALLGRLHVAHDVLDTLGGLRLVAEAGATASTGTGSDFPADDVTQFLRLQQPLECGVAEMARHFTWFLAEVFPKHRPSLVHVITEAGNGIG